MKFGKRMTLRMKSLKIKTLLAEQITGAEFDEDFIRSVANDRGVDLSGHSLEQVKKMHEDVLRNADLHLVDEGNVGQDYYDALKEYFS